ncbi:MAG: xanthine dehydrogenase small subunit [Ignavibacteriae bacterium]|nr:xanthine dehydrogenase small subunit [Ignavibacteriota bacterium]
MQSSISFILDGKITSIDFGKAPEIKPTTTILNYLRSLPTHKGTKEGCAEGDCGACTVVVGELGLDNRINYKSVDSCLVFLPMLHGKHLITVENLKTPSHELHPVQQTMVETSGSQCGYCTPGFIMSLFSLYKNKNKPSREEIDDALTGNLCRCTGYRPIIEAAAKSCVHDRLDDFSNLEPITRNLLQSIPKESLRIHTPQQLYLRPASLGEAITLKHQHPDAILVCGATDVALRVTKQHELLKEIIDLSDVSELKQITESDAELRIGAGAFLSDIMPVVLKPFPALHDMLAVFGSQQIRNLATLGGNLDTASPIGDTLPVLIAYNARVILEGVNGRREFPVEDFITGYRTTRRKADEIITTIVLPKLDGRSWVKAYKVSKRKDLDIATLSGCFRLELDNHSAVKMITLAYGGMAERVKRATKTEQFLLGNPWNREAIENAMPLIDSDFTPISDVRGGAEFRRVAAKNLLLKFWSETNGQS